MVMIIHNIIYQRIICTYLAYNMYLGILYIWKVVEEGGKLEMRGDEQSIPDRSVYTVQVAKYHSNVM